MDHFARAAARIVRRRSGAAAERVALRTAAERYADDPQPVDQPPVEPDPIDALADRIHVRALRRGFSPEEAAGVGAGFAAGLNLVRDNDPDALRAVGLGHLCDGAEHHPDCPGCADRHDRSKHDCPRCWGRECQHSRLD